MPDTVNPYIPGQPVDNPELFFGRRDTLASIREHLLKGRRVFVVSGAPRMGRSSLLRQLPHYIPEECVLARVELLEENAQRLDWLLWRLADAVGHQAGHLLGVGGREPTWDSFEGNPGALLDEFWPQMRAALGKRCLLLMLDDLDSLAETDAELLDSFLRILEVLRDRDSELALVLASSPELQDVLLREYPRLFGGALSYSIGPLNSEDASRLITWPVDGVLTYDYGVARRVIEVTSGHPYYLQMICFELFNRCAASAWVNQRDVDLVVEDLVGREIPDFRRLWHESSPQEQAVLAGLVSLRGARGVATVQEVRTVLNKAGARADRDQVTHALESLASRGIMERLGALSYRFRVGLLRDWLAERLDLQDVVRNTRWEAVGTSKITRGSAVPKLSIGRVPQRKPATEAQSKKAKTADGTEEEAGATGRRWLWIAAVVVLGLVLVVLGVWLFRPSPAEETPVAAISSPTVRLATATQVAIPSATVQLVVVPSPTDTAIPQPTETPSPTPPVVIARSVPSIAYQSRSAGESEWSVWVMSSSGGDRAVLAEGQGGFLSPPTWSPDGSKIAFVSDREGNPDIWSMDSDGSSLVNLTQHKDKDHSPAWSPDGEFIAFASVRDSLYWELYLMRPDGSDVQRLTWWEDASDLSPSWSPDGTRLAFASKRDGNWELYVMDRDGGNLARLTDHPADDTNPAWSPDGGRIAFASTRDGYSEIYVLALGGGEPINLSNAPFSSEHGPTWSPDGGRIAYYSDQDGEWDIYVMASDGSDVVKLTADNTNDQVPAWRP